MSNRWTWIMMSLLLLSINAFADRTAEDFAHFKSFAEHQQGTPTAARQNFHPERWFKGYTAHPAQAGQYPGVTADNHDMSGAAAQALAKDKGGETVYSNYRTRPRFTINTQSADIQAAKLIEDDSHNIARGQSDARVNCQQTVPHCTNTYATKICQTQHPSHMACTNTLSVTITHQTVWVKKVLNLSGHVSASGAPTAFIHLPDKVGYVLGFQMHIRNGHNPWSCFQWYSLSAGGQVVSRYHGSCGGGLGDLSFGLSAAQLSFQGASFPITLTPGGLSGTFTGSLNYEVEETHLVPVERWASSCGTPPLHCKATTVCTAPNQTHVINGQSIHKACWQYRTTYACGGPISGACLSLQHQGCQQIGSRCLNQLDGTCSLYEDRYQCLVKQCPLLPVCGKPTFCMNGDCTKHTPTQSKDFGEDAAKLAAVGKAGDQFKKAQNRNALLFGGRALSCHRRPTGYIDCCANSGWGKNINLAHCSQEEQDLGKAKEKYITTYLGEYCAHKILGYCTKHLQVSCVWPSKMARIIQEQAREGELHLSLGSPDSPNCRGISVQEMQRMDLGKVNFTNPRYPYPSGSPNSAAGIAADIKPNFPSEGHANSNTQHSINEDVAHDTPYHYSGSPS